MGLYREIIEHCVPRRERAIIVKKVQEAYGIVSELATEKPMFDWPVAQDSLGVLRRLAVEFTLHRACNITKEIPFKCHVARTEQQTSPYIRIQAGQLTLTTNQVSYPEAFPRVANFRDGLRGTNEPFIPGLVEAVDEEPCYAIITHGYRRWVPDFVCIGIPYAERKGWIDRINLMKELTVAHEQDLAPVEVSPETVIDFKEQLKHRKKPQG